MPDSPLDPDARAVIDRMQALNAPGYETMPPKAARAIAAHLRRNAPWPRVRVGAVRDFDLHLGLGGMRARQYRPFAPSTAALIYLHGGGWTLGDLDTMDHLCRSLVRRAGVQVIALDYPLAPESRCPQTVQACAEALREIARQGDALGIDPARLAIGGDSAGGNLAAVLATAMARDLPLRAQVLIYPALDLRPMPTAPGDYFLGPLTMAWFQDNYLGPSDPGDWRASPLLVPDLTHLPPTYILTAGHDLLQPQGLAYADRLTQAHVPVVARDFPGQIHNFVAMPYAIPTALVAIADLAEFLIDHLVGETGA